MDHKVSKDMISSGMIPSGEKSQADLGRTQYGSAPSPNSLFDAYKSMYEHHQKDKDGNTIPHEGEELNEGKIPAGLQAYLDKKKGKKEDKKDMKEENIDEVVFTGGAMLAGLAAKKLLGAAAVKGLKTGATMLAKKAAVKTMGMGARGALKTISKKGLAGAADKALGSAAMSTVKNPVNTMVGASLLKPTPKIPTPIDRSKKMTGARTAGVYASADLFDIVKGQLLDEGIDEKEALKIMVELSQQDLNDIVNEKFDIGKVRVLPAMAKLGTAALVTQQIASRMGKKSGEESIKPDKPNKPSLMQKIKTSTDAKNKAIEQM